MIVEASSGHFEVNAVPNALRQAYRVDPAGSITSRPSSSRNFPPPHNRNNQRVRIKTRRPSSQQKYLNDHKNSTFYTFKSTSSNSPCRAILDSGECTSIVGKITLDKATGYLGINSVQDASPAQEAHKFGDNVTELRTLCDGLTHDLKQSISPISASSHYSLQGNQSTSAVTSIEAVESYQEISSTGYSLPTIPTSLLPNRDEIDSAQINYPLLKSKPRFNAKDLRKLHLQLHHGSKTQMINWIKSADNNQFNKNEFINYLRDIGAFFVPSAANDHEANGAVESANRILRTQFRRIRALDHRSTLSDVHAEATYAKNIN
eukprot:IDg4981t1